MIKRKLFWLASAVALFSFLDPGPANAITQNYCLPTGEGLRIYFAPHKGASEIELNAYKASLNPLIKSHVDNKIGQRLELLLVTEAGVTTALSECIPGCPTKTIAQQIFGGGGCKDTLAKQDKKILYSKVSRALQTVTQGAKQGSTGYEAILPTLAAVQAHERINSGDLNNVLVSSMYVGTSANKKDLDKFFVKAVQNAKSPLSFPLMNVTGMPINADLINLWKDLYSLNGQTFTHE